MTLAARISADAWFTSRRFAVICLLLAVVGGACSVLGRSLQADDDNLWLLMATQKLTEREKVTVLENQVIERLKVEGAAPEAVLRFEQRRDYADNYIGAVAIWRAFGSFISTADASAPAFALRLFAMLLAGTVLCWALVAGIVARIEDRSLALGLAFGLAIAAIWVAALTTQPHQFLGLTKNVLLVLPKSIEYLVKPPDAFTVFGFTGRNMLTVLVLGVVFLRWDGRDRSAAWLYMFSFLLHASFALLLLPFLLFADLLLKPRRLADPLYLAPLAVGVVYALSVETLWRTTLDIRTLIIAVVAIVAVGLVAFFAILRVRRAGIAPEALLPRPLARGLLWLRSRDPVVAEAVVIAGAWLASVPVIILICQVVDRVSVDYFWGQIPSRSLGAFQPVFICAGTVWLVRRYGFDLFRALTLIACVIAAAGAGYGTFDKQIRAVERLTTQLRSVDRFVETGGRETGPGIHNFQPLSGQVLVLENVIYYALVRTIASGTDRLTPALAVAFRRTPP
jgi:hypothetical protein